MRCVPPSPSYISARGKTVSRGDENQGAVLSEGTLSEKDIEERWGVRAREDTTTSNPQRKNHKTEQGENWSVS